MEEGTSIRLPKTLARYTVSIGALCLAAVITLVIIHYHLPRQIVGYSFLLVIIGSAWWGGYGPGLLTAFATLLLGPYLVAPNYSIRHANFASMPQVILISVLISRMASTSAKLREANEKLDERVRQRTAELERANVALKEGEALLIRQAEELSQSNADLEQYAYIASHDLQEPLRMIGVYTELLQQRAGPSLDEQSTRFMRTVLDGVHRMERLIHDLLMYSRTLHGELAEPSEVDCVDAFQAAMINLEPVIQATGATIDADGLPKLIGHRVQMTQIFQNLVGESL